jgi:hypothetical protein
VQWNSNKGRTLRPVSPFEYFTSRLPHAVGLPTGAAEFLFKGRGLHCTALHCTALLFPQCRVQPGPRLQSIPGCCYCLWGIFLPQSSAVDGSCSEWSSSDPKGLVGLVRRAFTDPEGLVRLVPDNGLGGYRAMEPDPGLNGTAR